MIGVSDRLDGGVLGRAHAHGLAAQHPVAERVQAGGEVAGVLEHGRQQLRPLGGAQRRAAPPAPRRAPPEPPRR